MRKHIGSGEIFRFLTNTIDKLPILSVIIDQKTEELEEACASIPISDKRVTEFRIYERNDSSLKTGFLFEPIEKETIGNARKIIRITDAVGKTTPQKDYTNPILNSLIEKGGQAKVCDILNLVYDKVKDRLTQDDLNLLPSGKEKRWENQVRWQAFALKKNGIIDPKSPHGTWRITEQGRKKYNSF